MPDEDAHQRSLGAAPRRPGAHPGALPAPGLVTDRLLLRRWTAADLEPFARLNADPVVMQHFPAVLSRAESDAFVQRLEASLDEHGFGHLAVTDRATGELLGCAGLLLQTFEAHFTPAVEVGWRLARSAWGHGYATEAATAVLEDGFGRLGLTEVVSMTARGNSRSVSVMQRLGMTHDPDDDFDHPRLPPGHHLRRHVLHRLTSAMWTRSSR